MDWNLCFVFDNEKVAKTRLGEHERKYVSIGHLNYKHLCLKPLAVSLAVDVEFNCLAKILRYGTGATARESYFPPENNQEMALLSQTSYICVQNPE